MSVQRWSLCTAIFICYSFICSATTASTSTAALTPACLSEHSTYMLSIAIVIMVIGLGRSGQLPGRGCQLLQQAEKPADNERLSKALPVSWIISGTLKREHNHAKLLKQAFPELLP